MILSLIYKSGELAVFPITRTFTTSSQVHWRLGEVNPWTNADKTTLKSFTVFADTGGLMAAWTADSPKYADIIPDTSFRDMMKAMGLPVDQAAKKKKGPEDA